MIPSTKEQLSFVVSPFMCRSRYRAGLGPRSLVASFVGVDGPTDRPSDYRLNNSTRCAIITTIPDSVATMVVDRAEVKSLSARGEVFAIHPLAT